MQLLHRTFFLSLLEIRIDSSMVFSAIMLHNELCFYTPRMIFTLLLALNKSDNLSSYFNILILQEHDVGNSDKEEKTLSLLKMNFSLDEIGFAMQRLGMSCKFSPFKTSQLLIM